MIEDLSFTSFSFLIVLEDAQGFNLQDGRGILKREKRKVYRSLVSWLAPSEEKFLANQAWDKRFLLIPWAPIRRKESEKKGAQGLKTTAWRRKEKMKRRKDRQAVYGMNSIGHPTCVLLPFSLWPMGKERTSSSILRQLSRVYQKIIKENSCRIKDWYSWWSSLLSAGHIVCWIHLKEEGINLWIQSADRRTVLH